MLNLMNQMNDYLIEIKKETILKQLYNNKKEIDFLLDILFLLTENKRVYILNYHNVKYILSTDGIKE